MGINRRALFISVTDWRNHAEALAEAPPKAFLRRFYPPQGGTLGEELTGRRRPCSTQGELQVAVGVDAVDGRRVADAPDP